jgi:hypothetical protein
MNGANYSSGDDYVVEFLGYRFSFNAADFEQRVTAAAVKLGLLEANELDDDETADLVELAAEGRIDEPRSPLGRYLVRHWERISLVEGESLVDWLRKLIFRGAWLDHRVKESLLEVVWDDESSEFAYRDPRGGRALLELAPVPSWHELQYRPRRHRGTARTRGPPYLFARANARGSRARHREAELGSLLGSLAELDPPDRSDRNDHLARDVLARMWTDRDEPVSGRRVERLDRIAGAVRELDLDVRLLDARLLGELLDPPMDPVDQVVERACEPGNPQGGHLRRGYPPVRPGSKRRARSRAR